MKKHLSVSLLLLSSLMAPLSSKEAPLNDPIIRSIDGLPGLIDKTKIEHMLWFIKEINSLHHGSIKVSAQGIPDPRSSKVYPLIFRKERQTIKTLLELEKQIPSFSPAEKAEFEALFKMVKTYLGKANEINLADARGSEDIMVKLIQLFCRNRNRPNSPLLHVKKGSEMEIYNNSVTSFMALYLFSADLMTFLADLVKSCPKAYKAYSDSIKKTP